MAKPRRDPKTGRFLPKHLVYIDDQGYPRIGFGKMRGKRLHQIIAEAKLGRLLTRDEDIHHEDGDKLNFHPDNLKILGHAEHGAVSASQHWYVKQHDIHLEKDWNDYFEHEQPIAGGGREC